MLLCRDAHGRLPTYADLSPLSVPPPWNELVVDGRGNAYLNGSGSDLMAGAEFAPGVIALVIDGSVRQVADGLAFPNGMLVMQDNSTLIVAESYAKRLTAFDIEAPQCTNRPVARRLGRLGDWATQASVLRANCREKVARAPATAEGDYTTCGGLRRRRTPGTLAGSLPAYSALSSCA